MSMRALQFTTEGRTYPFVQLRSLKDNWDTLDGTVWHTPDDQKDRYLVGPRWNSIRNTCSVDCAIVAGIAIDALRLQVDQVDTATWNTFSPPLQAFKQLTCNPWGLATADERDRRRDEIFRVLQANPADFSGILQAGKFMSVSEIMRVLYRGLPQLTWTEIYVMVCCDDVTTARVPPTARQLSMLNIALMEGQTLAGRINEIFGPVLRTSFDNEPCSAGDKCTRDITRRKVILDRLPPVLQVEVNSPIVSKDTFRRYMSPITIQYVKPSGPATAKYQIQGCIWLQHSHYVVRWMNKFPGDLGREIGHYDGAENDARFTKCSDSWLRDLDVTATLQHIIFLIE